MAPKLTHNITPGSGMLSPTAVDDYEDMLKAVGLQAAATTTTPPTVSGDPRFTVGLIYDVFKTLEAHGYTRPDDDLTTGLAASAVFTLVKAFEGRS